MLADRQRMAIVVVSVLLTVPVFMALFAGVNLIYLLGVLSGYHGTPFDAVLLFLRTGRGVGLLAIVVLIVAHLATFLFLLVRFARGRVLPLSAQYFCLSIAILVLAERIRLLLSGDAFMWFGLLSLPHLLCLLGILWASRHAGVAVPSAKSGSWPTPA